MEGGRDRGGRGDVNVNIMEEKKMISFDMIYNERLSRKVGICFFLSILGEDGFLKS